MATHWKKLTNPNYLGSWDFEPNEERLLTIEKVTMEQIPDMEKGGSAKKDCTLAYFLEKCKPMVLNKTNCKVLSSIHDTPFIEEWAGKRIKVHVERVRAFGKIEDGLRIMKQVPLIVKCADCSKDVVAKDGFTAEQIIKTSKDRYGIALCISCGKKRK